MRSRTVGGTRGGDFEEFPEDTAVLVGFRYTTSRLYGGHLTIKSIKPVFQSQKVQVEGTWHGRSWGDVRTVIAKEGYAVAGIIAKSGHRIDGIRVLFMKVRDGRLNPDDTYRSRWIGGLGGGPETLCGYTGEPITGIFGRQGHDLDSLGFIHTAR